MAAAATLVAPTLYRIPFLLIISITSMIATARTNRAPESAAQKRYDSKGRDPLTIAMSWFLPTIWVIMHMLSISELYVTLAAAYPSLRSSTLLSVLLSSEDLIAPMAERMQVTPTFVFGTLLCTFGASLRLLCYRHLGRYFTLELALLQDHQLVTDGPYKFVRHPSYTGIIAFAAGLMLCQYGSGSWWAEGELWSKTWGKVVGTVWVAFIAFSQASVIFIRVPKEDEVLRKAFGKQWISWSKRTPYRLLPYVY